MKKELVAALTLCVSLFDSSPASADVTLTGLLHQGAEPSGQSTGSPIWNTLGNELSFANIYLTAANSGPTGAFINHGNGDGARISVSLAPGSYDFWFACDQFANNNPGQYSLNLFFDSNDTSPGISAYSPFNVASANAVPFGAGTLALNGSGTTAPGSLTYTAQGLNVTLTSYGFGSPGFLSSPIQDRVANLNDSPNGEMDAVGFFSITVAAVPEPSAAALIVAATALASFSRRFSK